MSNTIGVANPIRRLKYELQPESAHRLNAMISSTMGALRSFVLRGEQKFEFHSDAIFHQADIKIVSAAFAPRDLDTKALDVVLSFDFTDVQLQAGLISNLSSVTKFLTSSPKLMEVKYPFPPSPNHLPFAVQAYGPNSIIIGQIDHFGDPEVLFTSTLAKAFNGLELRVIDSQNL